MDESYVEKVQIRKENKLAGLYPATKLVILLLYCIWVFILKTYYFTELQLPLLNLIWIPFLFILFAISGEFKKCLKACNKIFFIAAVIFVAQSLLIAGDYNLFEFGIIRISNLGLKTAFSLSTILFDVAGIFVWVFQTTSNREIGQALEEKKVNYKVSYVFVSTLNMIDILAKNSQTIMNAQRARGVETEGNMLIRAKAFVPSFIPLILSAITGAEERVLTLESRGFNVQCPKVRVLSLSKSGLEKPLVVICSIITITIVAWRIVLWVL